MLIDDVKTALRISHDRLDAEITQHIAACCDDMKRVGIAIPDNVESVSDNALLTVAVQLWCKAQYDFIGKGEEFKKGYEGLRDSLSLSSAYKEDTDGGDDDV